MFSLFTRAFMSSGVLLSISLVTTKGLCWRLPVGRPLAASRGDTISCAVAMTMIESSRPA